jgi:hypothetical protein
MSRHPIRFGIASGQQLYEWAQLVELWKTADPGTPERMRHFIEVMLRHGDKLGRDIDEI